MKREEITANEYFLAQGYCSIQYEPDGNIPPDFLLNDSIAVEVRRLNQHFRGQKIVPLEELEYQLMPRMRNLLKSINVPEINSSAFLTISYARPLRVDKRLISDIETILYQHIPYIKEQKKYHLRENLQIRIWPTKRTLPNIYNIGVQNDQDTGGVILGKVCENLKIAIKEKIGKIEPYIKKYKEWWLLLIDQVGFSLEEDEIKQLQSLPIETYYFKKIVIISDYDHKKVIIIDHKI